MDTGINSRYGKWFNPPCKVYPRAIFISLLFLLLPRLMVWKWWTFSGELWSTTTLSFRTLTKHHILISNISSCSPTLPYSKILITYFFWLQINYCNKFKNYLNSKNVFNNETDCKIYIYVYKAQNDIPQHYEYYMGAQSQRGAMFESGQGILV